MSRRSTTSRLLRPRPLVAVSGSLALGASVLLGATAAQAGTAEGSGSSGAGQPTVVAQGLNSPRLLSFGPRGALYVAEAGNGGSGPCVTGEMGQVCFGTTGSVTKIWNGHQHRVLRHLPSVAGEGGAEPLGPADVLVGHGGRYLLSMGLGQPLENRRMLGRKAHKLGTWVIGQFGHRSHVLADLAAFEARTNLDNSPVHDTDPTGIALTRHGLFGTDSGGNTLVKFAPGHRNHVRAVALFPDVDVPQPGGGTGPMDAVPTSVAVGPDGALYMSQLTGFPFPAGAAHIFRIVPGHAPTVWASGLTNVTDIAWSHGRLYAVQISDTGLLTGVSGSLLRVHRGDNSTEDTVAGGLTAPYGVAIRHGAAYVTTCAVGGPDCTGHGTVVRIPLR